MCTDCGASVTDLPNSMRGFAAGYQPLCLPCQAKRKLAVAPAAPRGISFRQHPMLASALRDLEKEVQDQPGEYVADSPKSVNPSTLYFDQKPRDSDFPIPKDEKDVGVSLYTTETSFIQENSITYFLFLCLDL